VEFVSYLGAAVDVHVRLSPADRVIVQVPNRADAPLPALGERVEVGWPRKAGLVFAEPATAEQQERGT
jgi:putative spermidine/putrescine transport system ATP-binding protein